MADINNNQSSEELTSNEKLLCIIIFFILPTIIGYAADFLYLVGKFGFYEMINSIISEFWNAITAPTLYTLPFFIAIGTVCLSASIIGHAVFGYLIVLPVIGVIMIIYYIFVCFAKIGRL